MISNPRCHQGPPPNLLWASLYSIMAFASIMSSFWRCSNELVVSRWSSDDIIRTSLTSLLHHQRHFLSLTSGFESILELKTRSKLLYMTRMRERSLKKMRMKMNRMNTLSSKTIMKDQP